MNRLIKANTGTTTTYKYDGSNLRVEKISGLKTTKYYYDGQNIINETKNNQFSARNIRGINLIAREDKQGTKAYYIYNGHQDVVNLILPNGEIINTYEYDIYGKEKKAEEEEEAITNPYRYAGQYYDKETGLYYLKSRYYDPYIARFITEDTYKGDIKNPLSLNLYTYCKGNPI
ncbi:RHS repeat-associated core domain-containing protein, partial [Caloranaerobacter sp. DY30410]|uniref:RHS repeat-associated core domain-containing protein n=1 Tax=Caloranaerobacter sp. DY30410 TaxID=3238305 RepID=UPI003D03D1F6